VGGGGGFEGGGVGGWSSKGVFVFLGPAGGREKPGETDPKRAERQTAEKKGGRTQERRPGVDGTPSRKSDTHFHPARMIGKNAEKGTRNTHEQGEA